MEALRFRLFGSDGHKYAPLGGHNGRSQLQERLWRRKHFVLLVMLVALAGFAAVIISRYDQFSLQFTDVN